MQLSRSDRPISTVMYIPKLSWLERVIGRKLQGSKCAPPLNTYISLPGHTRCHSTPHYDSGRGHSTRHVGTNPRRERARFQIWTEPRENGSGGQGLHEWIGCGERSFKRDAHNFLSRAFSLSASRRFCINLPSFLGIPNCALSRSGRDLANSCHGKNGDLFYGTEKKRRRHRRVCVC